MKPRKQEFKPRTRPNLERKRQMVRQAGEPVGSVQVAMLAGLPCTALRDAIFTHPTMAEGLIMLFDNVPPVVAAVPEQPVLHA